MDSRTVDEAMRKRLPVMYDGTRYDRIIEYISWYDRNSKHRLSVVLQRQRYSVRVPADKVTLEEGTP